MASNVCEDEIANASKTRLIRQTTSKKLSRISRANITINNDNRKPTVHIIRNSTLASASPIKELAKKTLFAKGGKEELSEPPSPFHAEENPIMKSANIEKDTPKEQAVSSPLLGKWGKRISSLLKMSAKATPKPILPAMIHDRLTNMQRSDSVVEPPVPKYMVNPNGQFKGIWEIMKFVLQLYIFIYLPYKASFLEFVDPNIYFYTFDKIIDLIFLIDMVLTFLTPVYKDLELVFSYKIIAKSYLKGWFWLDLLALIPFSEIFNLLEGDSDFLSNLGNLAKGVRILRLAKLLRLLRAFEFASSDNFIMNYLKRSKDNQTIALFLPILVTLCSFLHCATCIWYFIGTVEDPFSEGWIYLNRKIDKSLFDKYVVSAYFVITTATSCGYGDVITFSPIETWYKIIVIIIGALQYGFFTGRIIDYRNSRVTQEETTIRRLSCLEEISKEYSISEGLLNTCMEALTTEKVEVKKKYDLSMLSQEDRDMFDYYIFYAKASHIPLVGASKHQPDFILSLCRNSEKIVFEEEQAIYHRGDLSHYFYLIDKGTVSIVMHSIDLIPIMHIHSGFFGEYEILMRMDREHTVIAHTRCELYRIEQAQFKKLLLEYEEFCAEFKSFARQRREKINKLQANFDDFLRRKIFWKVVLKHHHKTNELKRLIKDANKNKNGKSQIFHNQISKPRGSTLDQRSSNNFTSSSIGQTPIKSTL